MAPAPAPAPAPDPAPAPAPVAVPAPDAAPPEATPDAAPTSPESLPSATPDVAAPEAPTDASTGAATAAAAETPTPAPQPEYMDVPINIGLFPSLSINGSHKGRKVKNSLSASFGWSRAAKLDGLAVAFLATIIDEEARGVTWSMAANIAHGTHHGWQATHGYNHATVLHGVQTGAVNHAGEATGAQLGMVNVGGKVRGVQIGLINYAEEADASFALLPITKKGGVRAEAFTSDTALINVGIRLPANYTYAFIAGGLHPMGHRQQPQQSDEVIPLYVGKQPDEDRGRSMQIGLGFGGHLPVHKDVFLDLDMAYYGVTSGLDLRGPFGNLGKLRMMAGWQAAPHLAVYGGPTLNVMVDDASRPATRPGYGWVLRTDVVEGFRIRVWPGFVAGMRF